MSATWTPWRASLTALIGIEREIQGKSAGLRTQTIVGTASALILLVSKYGFADVLVPGLVIVDPSRVAAQIVTGIGFLGAGIIIFRRGSVHGLTTAASVWESAAIGMAAELERGMPSHVTADLGGTITLDRDELRERMSGNLCRCGAYSNIVEAMVEISGAEVAGTRA